MEHEDWQQFFQMQVLGKHLKHFERLIVKDPDIIEFTALNCLRPEAKNVDEFAKPHVWRRVQVQILSNNYQSWDVESLNKAARQYAGVSESHVARLLEVCYYKQYWADDEDPVVEKAQVLDKNDQLVKYICPTDSRTSTGEYSKSFQTF